jgi:hypothetical protein
VKVRRNEGVAIHIDPKPCAGTREGDGEASAGERIGQPLSRESDKSQGAHGVSLSEGNTAARAIASVRSGPAWSETLACTEAPCAGTGRSPA